MAHSDCARRKGISAGDAEHPRRRQAARADPTTASNPSIAVNLGGLDIELEEVAATNVEENSGTGVDTDSLAPPTRAEATVHNAPTRALPPAVTPTVGARLRRWARRMTIGAALIVVALGGAFYFARPHLPAWTTQRIDHLLQRLHAPFGARSGSSALSGHFLGAGAAGCGSGAGRAGFNRESSRSHSSDQLPRPSFSVAVLMHISNASIVFATSGSAFSPSILQNTARSSVLSATSFGIGTPWSCREKTLVALSDARGRGDVPRDTVDLEGLQISVAGSGQRLDLLVQVARQMLEVGGNRLTQQVLVQSLRQVKEGSRRGGCRRGAEFLRPPSFQSLTADSKCRFAEAARRLSRSTTVISGASVGPQVARAAAAGVTRTQAPSSDGFAQDRFQSASPRRNSSWIRRSASLSAAAAARTGAGTTVRSPSRNGSHVIVGFSSI